MVNKPLVMNAGLPTATQLADTDIAGTTTGAIPFVAAGALVEDAAELNWDNTGKQLNVTVTVVGTVAGAIGAAAVGTLQATRLQNSAAGASMTFIKGRGTSFGAITAVATNDLAGTFNFQGYGSSTVNRPTAAFGATVIEPTPSPTAMGGRLTFSTTALGASSVSETARFESGTGFSMFGANPVVDQNRLLCLRNYTVATLPTAPGDGRTAYITDSFLVIGFGIAIGAGGGTNHMPVYYNTGTGAWMVG